MNSKLERRKSTTLDNKKAYKEFNLKRQLERERRADYIEQLVEVQQQKKTFNIVFFLCIMTNLVLLSLAIYGGYFNG